MKDRWHRANVQLNNPLESVPVPIVSDAAVATIGVADGRLVPLVIIDSSSRPDIEDAIRAHLYLGPGDVESAWVRPSRRNDMIGLFLKFTRPSRCAVLLEFDITHRGGLVDSIVRAQGLYLQCGREGDRLKSTLTEERILVEVPAKAFQEEWNKLFRRVLEKDFRKRGLNRNEAKRSTEEFIKQWRTIGATRMKD